MLVSSLFFLLILLTLTHSSVFQDYSQTDFDGGTYELTNISNFENLSMGLDNDTATTFFTQGNFTSRIFDAGATATWNNISWIEGVPYQEELPNYQADEKADGIMGGANMTGNVLLMNFNNDSSYGDSDFTVFDFSGNENNGTGDNVTVTGSKFGRAMQFDGVDDLVSATSASSLNDIETQSGGGMTISAWIYPRSWGDNNGGQIIGKSGIGGTSGFWYLQINGYVPGFVFSKDYATVDLFVSGGTVTLNAWQHVVLTWDGSSTASNVKLYIDGGDVPFDGDNGTGSKLTDAANDLIIGHGQYSGYGFDGLIDEVALWNRTLSSDEIEELYRRGANKLRTQVTTCDDSSCLGETFVGPDNSSDTYFENATLETLNTTLTPDNRYLQYKAFFETNSTSFTPELYNVTIGYTLTSDSTSPTVSLESPDGNATNTTSNAIDFNYNVSESSTVDNCTLIINDIMNVTSTSITKDTTQNLTTYLPNAEYNWSVNCTDSSNNIGSSETRNLSISVSGSNTNPLFEPIGDFSQAEDFAQFTMNLQDNVSDAEDADGSLVYNWTVNDTSILTLDIINTTGVGTFTAAANASGSALITISVVDTGGLSNSTEFSITVSSVNDAPWLEQLSNITLNEDNGSSTIYTSAELNNSFRDVEDDQTPATLTLLGQSDTSAITCSLGNGIVCTSVANQSGSNTITIEMNDTGNSAARQLITLTLNPVNDAPFPVDLTEPANGSTFEVLGEFNWTNTTDIDNDTILYILQIDDSPAFTEPSTYYNGSISETDNTTEDYPTGFAYGVYYWRVLATDGIDNSSWSEVRMFNYSAPNTNPNFDSIGDFALDEDFGTQNINLSDNVSDSETPDNQLTFTWTVNDTGIVTLDIVNSTNIATFTSVSNASGSVLVNITVWDAGLMQNSTSFALTVNAVNDNPWIDQLSNITINEDNGSSTIYTSSELNNSFRDVEEDQAPTTLTMLSQSDTSAITCSLGNGIVCTSVANQSGTDTLTFEMNDSNVSAVRQLITVTVDAVNDAPFPVDLNEPANETTFEVLGEFNWTNTTDIDNETIFYVLQVGDSPAFTEPSTYYNGSISETDNTTEDYPTGFAYGVYYWRVLATDNIENSSWSEVRMFNYSSPNTNPNFDPISDFTLDEDFGTQAINLSDNVTDSETPDLQLTFTWTVNDTSTITLDINNATNIATFTSFGNASGSVLVNITVWDAGFMQNSTSFTLTVNAVNDAPSPVDLNAPDNNTFFLDSDLMIPLNWTNSTDPEEDPITYYLEIWNESTMQNIMYVNSSIAETTDPTGDIVTFPNETSEDFFWRVLASDGVANSSWSELWNVSTGYTISSLNPNVTSTLSLPSDSSTDTDGNITFECNATATESQLTNISLYINYSAWHLNQTNMAAGTENSTSFTLSNIPNGTTILWNCEACNNETNCSFAPANWTVTSNANTIYASTCSNTHVQAAVDAANDGNTVVIPAGSCTWTGTVSIDKRLTLQGAGVGSTILQRSNDQMIVTTGESANNLRITALEFRDCTQCIYLDGDGSREAIKNFHMDNCTFKDAYVAFETDGHATGVINNCTFYNSYGSRIYGKNDASTAFPLHLGTSDAVYFEDNNITISNSAPPHFIASNSGSRYVLRYNTFDYSGWNGGWSDIIDAHGYCEVAGRGSYTWEVYDNIFKMPAGVVDNRMIHLRGGQGVVYNNRWNNDMNYGISLTDYMTCSPPCVDTCSGYPCQDQINRAYFWNNKINCGSDLANCSSGSSFSPGNDCDAVIQLNRDYYESEMPGYTPYDYPHPLASGVPGTILESPPDYYNSSNTSVTFNCSAIDDGGLLNMTLYANWSGAWDANQTNDITGTDNLTQFTVTLEGGEFEWNCLACDDQNNCDWGNANYTLTIQTTDSTAPTVNLELPGDNATNTTSSTLDFTYNVSDASGISNCSLIINDLVNVTSTSITKDTVGQNLTIYLSNGEYNWSVNCTDSANNQGASETRNLSVSFSGVNTNPLFEPVSDFTQTEDFAQLTINLTDNVTDGEDGDSSLTYNWTVNDTTILTLNILNTTGIATFTAGANASGSALITISVVDTGGLTNSTQFTIIINPVNDQPWLTNANGFSNLSVSEDASAFNAIEQADMNSNFSDVEDNNNPTVTIASQSGASVASCSMAGNALQCTPQANQSGTNVIVLNLSDSGSLSFVVSIQITVNAVNDQAWWDSIPNNTASISEDSPNQNVTIGYQTYFRDVEDDQNPTLSVIGTNETSVTCSISSGDIQCTPTSNFTGLLILTINGSDTGSLSATASFEVSVTAVNDSPWIDQLSNITMNEDNGTSTIYTSAELNNSFRDVEDDQQPISITLLSQSDTSAITCSLGNGIVCTSVANQSGTDTLTFEMNDSNVSAVRQLITVTVDAVNDAPFPVDLNEPANETTFEVLGEFNWTNTTDIDNETIFYVLQVGDSPAFTEPSTYYNGSISETDNTTEDYPTGFAYGVYYWRVLATDNIENSSWSEVRMFNYSSPNTNPNFDPISDFTLDEDFGTQAINLSDNVTDSETPDLQLTFTWTVNDTSILTLDIVNTTNIATFSSVANASGSALINITVWDAGLMQNSTTFTLTVNAVNDNPWIDQLSNITMSEDNGTSTIYISAELNNSFRDVEADQTPTTITLLSQSNATAISCSVGDGVVCVTAANESGANTISIEMNDSDSNSTTQNFTITVSAVNDAPWWDLIDNATASVNEDSSSNNISDQVYWQDYFRDVEDDQNPSSPSLTTNDTNTMTCSITNGDLICSSLNNASGSVAVILSAQDSGALSTNLSFEIGITGINDQPWWDDIANGTASVNEDAANQNVTIGYQDYFRDAEDDRNPTLSVVGDNETDVSCAMSLGDIQCTPTSNFTGRFILTVNGSDTGGLSGIASFEVNVSGANDVPWLDQLANVTMNEDNGTSTIYTSPELNNSFRDVEDDQNPSSINLLSQSDTTALSCTIGDGISCVSVANQSGSNILTIEMNDSANNAVRELITITVSAVNDAPWWTLIGNSTISINEDTSNNNVSSQAFWQNYFRDVENDQDPTGTNSVSANSSDVTCALTNGDIICSATYNATGSFALTISAQDQSGGNTIVQDVEVAINPVNQQPWMDGDLSGVSANEDNGTFTAYKSAELNSKFRDVEEDQNPTSKSINSQSDVSAVSCSISGGDLQCTTVANASGTSTVNISYLDSAALSTSNTVVITISAVNDAPWVDLDKPDDNATNTTANAVDFSYTPRDVETAIINCSLIIDEETNLTSASITVDGVNNLTIYLTNGEYNWSVNCTDDGNNIVSSATRNLSVNYLPDMTSPTITLESPEDNATNTTSNALDFTYNVSDDSTLSNCTLIINDEINTTDETIQKDTPGQTLTTTLTNGEYNWSVNCTDALNNIGASEARNLSVNYTEPATTTSPSSGGTGGSSGTRIEGTGSQKETATLEVASPGPEYFEFTKDLAVRSITLVFNKRVTNPSITVEKISDMPHTLPMPEGRTYSIISISKNIKDEDLDGVIIKFAVPRTWLVSKGVLPDEIKLKRYNQDVWSTLPTALVSSDADNYYYESESGGMSYFAIGTTEEEPVMTQPVSEEPTDDIPEVTAISPEPEEQITEGTGEEKSSLSTNAVPTVILLVLLLAASLLWLRRVRTRRKVREKQGLNR